MTDLKDTRHTDLDHIIQEVRETLARNRLIEGLVERQDMPQQELSNNWSTSRTSPN